MNLCFTGRGAMLYPEEGNTAAYIEDQDNFYLIDCGEDVAHKLIQHKKLVKGKNYYLFVTHMHSDHVGSIGTLKDYLKYVCDTPLYIVYGDEMAHFEQLRTYLKSICFRDSDIHFIHENELPANSLFRSVHYVKSDHGNPHVLSCGLIFDTLDGHVLYTSDIKGEEIITDFMETYQNHIDKMYIDTSYTDSPVHLYFERLKEIIPSNLRDKIYCMHINNAHLLEAITEAGFHFVTKIGSLDKQDILELLRQYQFPINQYKVISSASLVLQGVKEKTNDLDITVSKELCDSLLKNYRCSLERMDKNGIPIYYFNDTFNFSINYYDHIDTIKFEEHHIQTVESVKHLKEFLNREKDQQDLLFIEKFLQ